MKKRIIICGAILAIAIICSIGASWYVHTRAGTSANEGPLRMRVGYVPVLVNLPLFVALENGYFAANGLAVDAVEVQSPNTIIDGMMTESLDGAGTIAYPVLFVAEERYPGTLRLFNSADETANDYVAAILVRNDSDIRTTADLKGKRIGVYSGLAQTLFLKSILAGMGLNPGDEEIIEIEPRLQLQGLATGQYDALSTVEPYTTIATRQGIARVLVENPRVRYVQDPFPSVATPLTEAFIEEHPAAAQAFLLGLDDAVRFIQEHPAEARQALSKYTPISENLTDAVRLPRFNRIGEENRTAVQQYADWMLGHELLGKRVDVAAMFNSTVLA